MVDSGARKRYRFRREQLSIKVDLLWFERGGIHGNSDGCIL